MSVVEFRTNPIAIQPDQLAATTNPVSSIDLDIT